MKTITVDADQILNFTVELPYHVQEQLEDNERTEESVIQEVYQTVHDIVSCNVESVSILEGIRLKIENVSFIDASHFAIALEGM